MRKKKQLESANICIVVSFGRSSKCDLKIAMAHTVGSRVTLTALGAGRKDGMNFTPNQNLKKMLETSGIKATEVTQENGND